jgi:ABC-type glycerol-3-phosphate transport system substrate-binding protein
MKRHFFCLWLVLLVLGSLLPVFAVGKGESSSPPAGGNDASKELTIMIRNIGMAPTNDNLINHEMERRTGFKLNWILGPANNYNERIATVLASGD